MYKRQVFNYDANNAWVAGFQTSSTWNGTTWTVRSLANPLTFNAVWASGIEDVWIAGPVGVFLRYHRDVKRCV